MQIPLKLGRGIEDRDRRGGTKVAVINERLAQIHFPNQSPIGRRFRVDAGPLAADYEVIGVVANTKFHALRRDFGPGFYAAWDQHQDEAEGMSFVIRMDRMSSSIAAAVRQAVADVDPAVPVLNLMTIEDHIDESLKQERLFAQLSTVFGLLALVLASVGLYGVRSYSVSRRTSEIGVRMALGASRAEITAWVMRETAGLTIVGVLIGIIAGLGATRLIRSMLYGLEPHDPAIFAGAAALLAVVAAVAGYLPARRASRVDPMVALRID
jgi:predicted permease